MAGKWDYSLINRIQQANDIIDVISEHMSLEKRGKEMVGLCPFHTDHKPSLYVNPDKQIFKCFACGTGGDVLKFVQMKENLTFPQAVERLAHRAGIAIEPARRQQDASGGNQLDPTIVGKLNAWALKLWVANLWDSQKGAAAREYLANRRLTEEMAKKWHLGLAVDAWDDLVSRARERKIADKYLIQGGLVVKKERGGCYDKFRNRLMFPIVDVTGRVIGFGGRTLGDDPAKYMNSPATVLFDKSNSLYGLYQAREAISLSGTAIIAEGYTDVMMAHQFGFENVVAALGTSLTDGHVKILRRYAKRIVLLFDSDVAGKAAANRALEVCLEQKIDVRLAFVPAGKDPCEYLLEAGADAFREVIEASEDVLEFKWKVLSEQLREGQNLSDRTEAIRRFLQPAAGAFEARQMDSISRAVVVSRLSELLGISSSRIEEEIGMIQKQKRRSQRNKEVAADQVVQGADEDIDLVSKSQREILEVLLEHPACFDQVASRISTSDFGPNPQLVELAEAVFEVIGETGRLQLSQVYARLQSPLTANLLTQLQTLAEQKEGVQGQLEGALKALEKRGHDSRIQKLKESLDSDDELKQIQQQIACKGPNLRNAGLY